MEYIDLQLVQKALDTTNIEQNEKLQYYKKIEGLTVSYRLVNSVIEIDVAKIRQKTYEDILTIYLYKNGEVKIDLNPSSSDQCYSESQREQELERKISEVFNSDYRQINYKTLHTKMTYSGVL